MKINMEVRNYTTLKIDEIKENDYNPNRMPKKEMELLKDCIIKYGFLFPILVFFDYSINKYRIIDGFHRFIALKELNQTEVDVVELKISLDEAIRLTVLMNRIKGIHQVEKMSDLVVKLEDLGLTDNEITSSLGMEFEEFLRLKQQLGIAHVFKDASYSKAWE